MIRWQQSTTSTRCWPRQLPASETRTRLSTTSKVDNHNSPWIGLEMEGILNANEVPNLSPRLHIWDGRVLSGHHMAARPHFWSFLGRFSHQSKSHPDKKLFRDEWSAKRRSSATTAAIVGTGATKNHFENINKFSQALFCEISRFIRWWLFQWLLYIKYKKVIIWENQKNCTKYPKSNSHSQIKRPEPSDGFLKYLEDEVSVWCAWAALVFWMEHPQCAAIWYGAATKRKTLEVGTPIQNLKSRHLFCSNISWHPMFPSKHKN